MLSEIIVVITFYVSLVLIIADEKMEAMLKLLSDEKEVGESEDTEALDEALIAKEGEKDDEICEARQLLIDVR